MDYKALLENSYKVALEKFECAPESRLEYLGDHIFDFTTYDGEMSALFARKAIEVCAAITNQETFDYIKEEDDYMWFLLMCNMPFFYPKLNWGTSIRGAWWDEKLSLRSFGLWVDGDEQLTDTLTFTPQQWEEFVRAMIEFASPDMKSSANSATTPGANPPA